MVVFSREPPVDGGFPRGTARRRVSMSTTPAHVSAGNKHISVAWGGRRKITGLKADAAVSQYRPYVRAHSQVLKGRHAFEGSVWQGLQVVLVQFSVANVPPRQRTISINGVVEKGGRG